MTTRLRSSILCILFAVVGLTAGVAATLAWNLPAVRHLLEGDHAADIDCKGNHEDCDHDHAAEAGRIPSSNSSPTVRSEP